jgi:hypothetical protein
MSDQSQSLAQAPGVRNERKRIDTNGVLLTFDALRAELEAISEADCVYWPQKSHSREDTASYQRRQERLKEVRLEMVKLGLNTTQRRGDRPESQLN